MTNNTFLSILEVARFLCSKKYLFRYYKSTLLPLPKTVLAKTAFVSIFKVGLLPLKLKLRLFRLASMKPADTQRCFNVYKTSIHRQRGRIDVL